MIIFWKVVVFNHSRNNLINSIRGHLNWKDEIREGVFLKKPNFIITIRYDKALFRRGGSGSWKFQPEAEIFGIFSIEVAPNIHLNPFKAIVLWSSWLFQLTSEIHYNTTKVATSATQGFCCLSILLVHDHELNSHGSFQWQMTTLSNNRI